MNKKIIALVFLIVVLGSILVAYGLLNQPTTEQQQYDAGDGVTEEDILKELDDILISEDDEIEIGEMI